MNPDNAKSPLTKDDIYVIGIHILFGIVIGVVFTDFKNELFSLTFTFKSAMVFVALTTILLSWVGYNSRVKVEGHNSPILFLIDIIIIYFYFQMSYSIDNNFSQYVFSLFLIFVSYLIWDIIKGYYDGYNVFSRTNGKFWKTLIEIISIVLFFGMYFCIENGSLSNLEPEYDNPQIIDYILLVGLIVIIFSFRQFEPPFENIWKKIKNH